MKILSKLFDLAKGNLHFPTVLALLWSQVALAAIWVILHNLAALSDTT